MTKQDIIDEVIFMHQKYSNLRVYIFSFLSPAIIFAAIISFFSTYPFGEFTIIKQDLLTQYIHFYSYVYDAVKANESFLYNWYAGLGSNHIGTLAYYTASPFLLIIFLFDHMYLSEAVTLIIILKIGFMGLAVCMMLKRKFPKMQAHELVIFSNFYSLMSYTVINYHNVMWLDALILLPLLIIMIEKLVCSRKFIMFTVLLTMTFIINFYMAYMLGLFIFLYFISELMVHRQQLSNRQIKVACLKFFIATVMACGLSAFLLLPTYLQLKLTAITKTTNIPFLETDMLSIYQKLFVGSYDAVLYASPYVYIGSFVWLLVPLFFLCQGISKPEKIRWATLLIFMCISILIPYLDYIWHGFAVPNGFLYRQSFLLSFVLFMMSVMSYMHYKAIKVKHITTIYIICMLLISCLLIQDDKTKYIMTLVTISLFYMALLFNKNNRFRQLSITLLILFMLTDVTYNTGSLYFGASSDLASTKKDLYFSYAKFREVIEGIKGNSETSLLRAKVDTPEIFNHSIYIKYGDLNNFNSMLDHGVVSTLGNLGLTTSKARYNDNGSTLFTESFFGLKYYISDSPINKLGYEQVSRLEDIYIYENLYAFPLGFSIDREILNLAVHSYNSPFILQNELLKYVSSSKDKIYEPIQYEREIQNGTLIDNSLSIKRIDSSEPVRVQYSLSLLEDKKVYTIINTSNLANSLAQTKSHVSVDGHFLRVYPYLRDSAILELGTYEKGTIKVEWVVDEDEFEIMREQFYVANPETYEEVMAAIEP
ncbi:YfhO family protein, partial [Caldalkalibacillus salinus]|uniref:YfhO family protein n=1 Tax=Caldalkalibacillus salinus TaxID=2803787 RepID=UPI001922055B